MEAGDISLTAFNIMWNNKQNNIPTEVQMSEIPMTFVSYIVAHPF